MGTPTRFYSNVAVPGTIGNPGGLSASATSLYFTSTPSGYPQQYPFTLRLRPGTSYEELASVVSGNGTQASPWIVTRGYDGTLAQSHPANAPVAHGMSAGDMTASRAHEALGSGSGVHGLPASAWGTSSLSVINETTFTNSTSSVLTWNSIPQIYAHLLVVVNGRLTSTSSQYGEVAATINGNSNARYSWLEIGSGTAGGTLVSVYPVSYYAQTSWASFIEVAASQAGSSVNGGGGFAIIPNYAGTSLNKMAVSMSGFGDGTTSPLTGRLRWCYFNPTQQVGINSLSLAASIGNFQSGTFCGLYGLGG